MEINKKIRGEAERGREKETVIETKREKNDGECL